MEPGSRGVLDTPPEPVIGLAEGEIRWRSKTASPSIQHPLLVRAIQRKRRHVDLKMLAALTDHLIASGHEARRRRQRHARGAFEALAGREHRLLADHALAAGFPPA